MADDSSNIQEQQEEIEALGAIYGENFVTVDEKDKIYEVRVCDDSNSWYAATIQVLLPVDYPSRVPPVFEVHSHWMSDVEMTQALEQIQQVCAGNAEQCMIYQMVERLQEFVTEKAKKNTEDSVPSSDFGVGSDEDSRHVEPVELEEVDHISGQLQELLLSQASDLEPQQPHTESDELELPKIIHGDAMVDRRSTFQAHAARVVTVQQVHAVVRKLNENRKIAMATHNVMAYRIFCEDKNSFLQDCDDDGETAAGSRLLHLLEILDVRDVVVVVSRWYGGIKLGPDRFKHINNCAREILKSGGYFVDPHENDKHSKNKSKAKNKRGR